MADTSVSRIAELEALLFSYGEPMAAARIAKSLHMEKKECEELIEALASSLAENPARGLMVMQHDGAVQLVTKPDLTHITERLLQDEFREELSPAGLETLSLITYLGPVPRSTVDYIRGVNASFTVRNLLMRGLVERKYEEGKGNIYHYFPSFQFLRHMGVAKVEELPEYERFHTALERLSADGGEETGTKEHAPEPAAAEPAS